MYTKGLFSSLPFPSLPFPSLLLFLSHSLLSVVTLSPHLPREGRRMQKTLAPEPAYKLPQ